MKLKKNILIKITIYGIILGIILGVFSIIPIVKLALAFLIYLLIIPIGIEIGAYIVKLHKITKDNLSHAFIIGAIGTLLFGIGFNLSFWVISTIISILGISIPIGPEVAFYKPYTSDEKLVTIFIQIISIFINMMIYTITGAIGGAIMATTRDKKIE